MTLMNLLELERSIFDCSLCQLLSGGLWGVPSLASHTPQSEGLVPQTTDSKGVKLPTLDTHTFNVASLGYNVAWSPDYPQW